MAINKKGVRYYMKPNMNNYCNNKPINCPSCGKFMKNKSWIVKYLNDNRIHVTR